MSGDVSDGSTFTSPNGNWYISGLVVKKYTEGRFTVTAPPYYSRAHCPEGYNCTESGPSCTCDVPPEGVNIGGFNFAIPYPLDEWNTYCGGGLPPPGQRQIQIKTECAPGTGSDDNKVNNVFVELHNLTPNSTITQLGQDQHYAIAIVSVNYSSEEFAIRVPYDERNQERYFDAVETDHPECECPECQNYSQWASFEHCEFPQDGSDPQLFVFQIPCSPGRQNPSCDTLTVTGLHCKGEGQCFGYHGTTLKLKVAGNRGNPAANVTRFSYCSGNCDDGSDWHNIPGGFDRGDWTYEEGTGSEISWVIPSEGGEGLWGVWGGIGYVPSPSDGNLDNDLEGRLCGGNSQTAWVPAQTYVQCDDNVHGNCSCSAGYCYKQFNAIAPPSCNSLKLFSVSDGNSCTNTEISSAHPGEKVCMKVSGTAGNGVSITSYRHGYELSNGGSGVFSPDPQENSERIITINANDMPGFDDTVTSIHLGASVIDSNNYECNGYGELLDRNKTPSVVVGLCTSNCRVPLQITRNPSLTVNKYVKSITPPPGELITCSSPPPPLGTTCKSNDLVGVDENIQYNIKIQNDGEAILHNVTLDDKLFLNNEIPPAGSVNIDCSDLNSMKLRKCTDPSCSSFGPDEVTVSSCDANSVVWNAISQMMPDDTWQATVQVTTVLVVGDSRMDNNSTVHAQEVCTQDACWDGVWHNVGETPPVTLEIKKEADVIPPQDVNPGKDVTFTITVTNPTTTDVKGVNVISYLSSNYDTYFVDPPISITPPSGVWDANAHTITWNNQQISNQSSATFRYVLHVKDDLHLTPPTCEVEVVDRAEVTGGEPPIVNPPPAYARIIIRDPVCGVSTGWTIVKTGTPDTLAPEGTVAFVLTITNVGSQGEYVTAVRDTLPLGFTYQNECTVVKPDGSTFTCTPAVSGQTIDWTFPTTGSTAVYVEPNKNIVITFKAKAPVTPGKYVNIGCLITPAGGCDDAVIYIVPGTAFKKVIIPIGIAGVVTILTGLFVVRNRFVDAFLYRGYIRTSKVVQKMKRALFPPFEEKVEKSVLKKRLFESEGEENSGND